MVISNAYLMIFALAMMGCVLATPLVTQIASWVGAIDRPDQFRRIHHGAIPRLGGLGLALGIAAGVVLPHLSGSTRFISLIAQSSIAGSTFVCKSAKGPSTSIPDPD